MKRKLLLLMMSLSLILAITGCNSHTPESNNQEEKAETVENTENTKKGDVEKGEDTEEDTRKSYVMKVYYVNNDEEITCEEKECEELDPDEIWNALIEKGLLKEQCGKNDFSVNDEDKTIDLDVNSGFGDYLRSMGITGEDEILTCVMRSYLESYQCGKIKITENGQALDTGHTVLDGYMTAEDRGRAE